MSSWKFILSSKFTKYSLRTPYRRMTGDFTSALIQTTIFKSATANVFLKQTPTFCIKVHFLRDFSILMVMEKLAKIWWSITPSHQIKNVMTDGHQGSLRKIDGHQWWTIVHHWWTIIVMSDAYDAYIFFEEIFISIYLLQTINQCLFTAQIHHSAKDSSKSKSHYSATYLGIFLNDFNSYVTTRT